MNKFLVFSLTILLNNCSTTSDVKTTNTNQIKLKNLMTQKSIPLKINRPTIIEFWASWCEGCSEAMDTIQNKVIKKSKRVHFYPISIDEELDPAVTYYNEKVKDKIKNLKGLYWDEDQVMTSQYQLDSLPKTILLDKKGKVIWEHVGGLKDSDIKKLQRLAHRPKAKKKKRGKKTNKKKNEAASKPVE